LIDWIRAIDWNRFRDDRTKDVTELAGWTMLRPGKDEWEVTGIDK